MVVLITYKIHLIRHGQTKTNKDGIYIGRTDTPLCEAGAEELQQLREDNIYPAASKVYVSPLLRCVQTAEILYPDHWTETLDELIEYDLGDFEGKSLLELKEEESFLKWMEDSQKNPPPNGETMDDLVKRCRSALDHIFKEMMSDKLTSVAVVTHMGVIMAMLSAYAFPQRPMPEWNAENGKGFTLLMTPQSWMRDGKGEVFDLVPYEK